MGLITQIWTASVVWKKNYYHYYMKACFFLVKYIKYIWKIQLNWNQHERNDSTLVGKSEIYIPYVLYLGRNLWMNVTEASN